MKNFGFKIHTDRQIDYDKNNKKLAQYLKQKEPSFTTCISCGTCSATCSAGQFTDFNPRKLFLLINRGETEMVHEEIKKCMLCGKCQLACPRGVNTRFIILNINRFYASNY